MLQLQHLNTAAHPLGRPQTWPDSYKECFTLCHVFTALPTVEYLSICWQWCCKLLLLFTALICFCSLQQLSSSCMPTCQCNLSRRTAGSICSSNITTSFQQAAYDASTAVKMSSSAPASSNSCTIARSDVSINTGVPTMSAALTSAPLVIRNRATSVLQPLPIAKSSGVTLLVLFESLLLLFSISGVLLTSCLMICKSQSAP
eukprot:5342-Heterococcus_DN1.PRE.1